MTTPMIDIDNSDIETCGFVLRVREDKESEYLRRHDQLWPEMKAALLSSGILHYEIWLHQPTRLLFAHQIRRRGSVPTPESEAVIERWRAYMSDVLELDGPLPYRETLSLQFRLLVQPDTRSSL